MINVNNIYLSTLDKVNDDSNGQMTIARFNRWLWLAQLKCQDWLSGDVANIQPPTPYSAQKDRDWLSIFITKFPVQVVNGAVSKPPDYNLWDNGYLLGNYTANVECNEGDNEETEIVTECNIPIQLLSGDEFYYRCTTNIEGLQPSFTKPFCKELGNGFEFLPKDLGSITIEYIRYPTRAFLGTKKDDVFNDLVYDPATSVDLEWSPFAEDVISWFIADMFFNFVSNQAGKTFNALTGKTVRDAK